MSLIISLILVVLLVLLLIFIYNKLIVNKNLTSEAFSTIDVMLKKRSDLIPNLIETIKGYTSYEKTTLESIVTLRNKAITTDANEKNNIEKQISQELVKVFALAESYPDLKASANFQSLQAELSNLETDIERSIRYYNATVRDFNTSIQTFPNVLVAKIIGFKTIPFWVLEDTFKREVPVVKF
ncbi:LemA family protein [Flavobacterium oreochromis]|uniref:LemA family protein n=1 Tax=Flavobacterium oreochromis TaxID=2906078 RepID=UPI00385E4076